MVLATRQLRGGRAAFALAAGDQQHQVLPRDVTGLFRADNGREAGQHAGFQARLNHAAHGAAHQADRAAGAFGGYLNTRQSIDALGAATRNDGFVAGAHARYAANGLGVTASVLYDGGEADTVRTLLLDLWPMLSGSLREGLSLEVPLPSLGDLGGLAPELADLRLTLAQTERARPRRGVLVIEAELTGTLP